MFESGLGDKRMFQGKAAIPRPYGVGQLHMAQGRLVITKEEKGRSRDRA